MLSNKTVLWKNLEWFRRKLWVWTDVPSKKILPELPERRTKIVRAFTHYDYNSTVSIIRLRYLLALCKSCAKYGTNKNKEQIAKYMINLTQEKQRTRQIIHYIKEQQ